MARLVSAAFVIGISVLFSDLADGATRGSGLRYGLAVAEGVTFAVGMLLFLAWFRRKLDELDERIRLEAFRVAFLVSALGLYGYGGLVDAGLELVALETQALVMFFLFATSAAWIRRRYA